MSYFMHDTLWAYLNIKAVVAISFYTSFGRRLTGPLILSPILSHYLRELPEPSVASFALFKH